MKKTLILALPVTLSMIAVGSITAGELSLSWIISGVLTGAIFAALMIFGSNWFVNRKVRSIRIPLNEKEQVRLEDAANHLVGHEGIGGKLAVTTEHLIFIPHPFNITRQSTLLPLEQIELAGTASSLGVLKNTLVVKLKSNETLKFVVDQPENWLEYLR